MGLGFESPQAHGAQTQCPDDFHPRIVPVGTKLLSDYDDLKASKSRFPALRWVWRSWLARQIVALEIVGSSPTTHPCLGKVPKGSFGTFFRRKSSGCSPVLIFAMGYSQGAKA